MSAGHTNIYVIVREKSGLPFHSENSTEMYETHESRDGARTNEQEIIVSTVEGLTQDSCPCVLLNINLSCMSV
jgi:hypothetical protein